MSAESLLANFFKPEIRKAGHDCFVKNKVAITSGSDTQIQAYVNAGASAKVKFWAASISSQTFATECSCSVASRGQLCKHIWATLLAVANKYPDFLDCKQEIEKTIRIKPEKTKFQINQANYKKQLSDLQKAKAKEQRLIAKQKKKSGDTSSGALPRVVNNFSEEVQLALNYFTENGFAVESVNSFLGVASIDAEALRLAKKKLSRVFHPDAGGSHAEIVELNRHFEVLIAAV